MQAQSPVIPDDPKVVQPIFKELKQNFLQGGTKTIEERRLHLAKLLEGFQALKG